MDENFRDAVYHLRWTIRHTSAGIRATFAPISERVRNRLPIEDSEADGQSPIEGMPQRLVDNLEGAKQRIGR